MVSVGGAGSPSDVLLTLAVLLAVLLAALIALVALLALGVLLALGRLLVLVLGLETRGLPVVLLFL